MAERPLLDCFPWSGFSRYVRQLQPDHDMKYLNGPVLCLLASFALLAAAGFFRMATQRAEMTEAPYLRAMEAVRATRTLATLWSAEVEKVRGEVDGNFDALADFAGRMDRQVRIILDSQSAMSDPPADVNGALDDYVQRLKAREEHIERFKSGLAIVRNSRRFVLRESAMLIEAARSGGYGKAETATLQILERTQSYLRQPTEVQSQRMEQAMSTLAESAAGTPLHTQAETLNKRVHALLRHHGLTEQRFEDVMRTDLEDRAERIIGLLDANHQQSRTKRRYFDYGFWASLGIAVFYWCTLVMQWIGRRRQRNAAAGAQEPVLAKGVPPHWGMDAALATAGGSGFPRKDAWDRDGFGAEGESVVQSRQAVQAQAPGRRTRTGEVPATEVRPRAAPEERLKAKPEARPAQRPKPLPEDAREKERVADKAPGDTSVSSGARKYPGEAWMANVRNSLRKVMGIDGAIGAALVDVNDELTLASAGGEGAFDIEAASVGSMDVFRAGMEVMEQLDPENRIEDIQITLGRQYHLIRPLDRDSAGVFLYVTLDRERGNLGMALHQLKGIEEGLSKIPGD